MTNVKNNFKLLFAFLSFCLLSSDVACTQSIDNFQKIKDAFFNANSTQVLVIAHRGAHNDFPENSLASIVQAIKLGVDIVEIDVRISRDGVPILMHDRNVERTTNGKGNVEDLTLSELKSLHLIAGNGALTHRIPTLKDALELTKGNIMVDLDLQAADLGAVSFLPFTLRRVFPDNVEPILDVVRETGTVKEVFFFNRNYRILQIIQAVDGRFMLMPRVYSSRQTAQMLPMFNSLIVHISLDFYSPAVMVIARNHGVRVWVNALGDVDRQVRTRDGFTALRELLRYRANFIQTDEPEVVLTFLRKHSLHW